MTDTPTASGADLARQAFAAARAAAKTRPDTPAKRRTTVPRGRRGEGRDPQGLGNILGRLTAEQGWDAGLGGGNVIDQWPQLCPQYVGLVQPVHYDDETGRLDLRPGTHSHATQLRLLGGQLAKQINDKLGRPVVRTIRVLPVGRLDTPEGTTAGGGRPVPEAPVKTRETAHPGYRATLAVALEHRIDHRRVDPYEEEARRRQEAALRAGRPDPDEDRDAYWAQDSAEAQAGPRAGSCEASRQAALARKRQEAAGAAEPRRLFGAA